MIVIYHTLSKKPIIKNLANHDAAATVLQSIKDQNIISTQMLAIADLSELEYQTNKTSNNYQSSLKSHQRKRRGHVCPWKGMKMEDYRKMKREG